MQEHLEAPAFRPRGRSLSHDLPYAGKWSLICSASGGVQPAFVPDQWQHRWALGLADHLHRAEQGGRGGLKATLAEQMSLPGIYTPNAQC